VIDKLGLKESPTQLGKMINAVSVQNTQLIRVSAIGSTPQQAAQLANTVAEVFTGYLQKLQLERYNGPLKNLQDRMDAIVPIMTETQSKIDSLSRSKIDDEAELARLTNQLDKYRNDYRTLQQDYQSLQTNVTQLTDKVHIVDTAQLTGKPGQVPPVASVTLLVSQDLITSGSGSTALLTSDRMAQTYAPMIKSQTIMETTIKQVNLADTPDSLAKRVVVEPVAGTQLIRISISDADATRAVLLVDTIAKAFVSQIRAQLAEPFSNRLVSMQKQLDDLTATTDKLQEDIKNLTAKKTSEEAELTQLGEILNENRVDLRALQQEYDQSRLLAAGSADAVVVISAASEPNNPAYPRGLYTVIAGLGGGLLGIGLVFLLEVLNDKIRTSQDVRSKLGLYTLGAISQLAPGKKELLVSDQPESIIAEDFRKLGANLRYANADHPFHTLLVTSSVSDEGKSTVVANLAVTMAKMGMSVVAVDADLRLPQLHRIFGLHQKDGLTNSLVDGNIDGNLQLTHIKGLSVLTSGDAPANPSEFISSPQLAKLIRGLSKKADLVLVDCPPVLALADVTLLAPASDGVLVVVRSGNTWTQAAQEAIESLRKAKANLVGVILNGVNTRRSNYYKKYRHFEKKGRRFGKQFSFQLGKQVSKQFGKQFDKLRTMISRNFKKSA